MTELSAAVAAALDADVRRVASLTGGDVAASFRLELTDGRTVFAKTKAGAPPEFFVTEAEGLRWLRSTGAVRVPDVLAVADDPLPFLVLEWIDEGRPTSSTEVELGRTLAALHRAPWSCFGRPDGRSTGSRGLPNDPAPDWVRFFAERRLHPLADLAERGAHLPSGDIGRLRDLADRLADLAPPPEPPALLHGDLWAGNRLVGADGSSWLIDPAAHGSHREFDLAMMRLFGGFGEDCFAAYHEVFPLADGWEARVPLHQLAPLVVHAIKFGGGYVGGVRAALDRLC